MTLPSYEILTLQVARGANIRAKDINHVSPLMQAAQYGYLECVQYLLSLGKYTLYMNT